MKRVSLILFAFLSSEYGILNTAMAKDFGIHGHTFDIQEPDILKQLEDKLHHLEKEGALAKHKEALIVKAEKALHNPQPVPDLTKATESKVFYYDPSISVPYDLKDHKGRVFHKAGTTINPLKFRSLPSPLIFIDGRDKAQIQWIEKSYLHSNQGLNKGGDRSLVLPPKIILTSGSPFGLMKQWSQPVYFDQGGKITKKLGIKHVPTVVTQEGMKLKISEIALKEGAK